MKKYCVLYPLNFIEYVMLLNLFTYFNSNNRKNLIIYTQKNINDEDNIFNENNLRLYKDFKPYITSNVNLKEFEKVNIFNLFLNTIVFNNVSYTFNNIFSKLFVTKFMITKQFIKKKSKNRGVLLINLSNESIKNIFYYIISIQALYKIEYVRENKTFDETSKIKLDNNDYSIFIHSDCKENENENTIYSKQFIHQLCMLSRVLKKLY